MTNFNALYNSALKKANEMNGNTEEEGDREVELSEKTANAESKEE